MTDTNKLREALERAQEDINWMLNSRKFLNGHVFDYIDEALAASKPEPQAQAVEPEVVAYIQSNKEGTDLIWDWDYDEELDGNLYSYEPLITLQDYREAMANRAQGIAAELETAWEDIAKKDAALKACVEALELAIDTSYSEATNQVFKSAITQAEGAMK